MLAQNFKAAANLGLTETQKAALMKVLVLLETGKLVHMRDPSHEYIGGPFMFSGHFNMDSWSVRHECGTIACIGGTAELVGNLQEDELDAAASRYQPLHELFYPFLAQMRDWSAITPAQAAIALRTYLTTGNARWDLVVTTGKGN
jgi:hypothetical protein